MKITTTEPCMQEDLRDRKITCGYATGHDGPCSFGPRRTAISKPAGEDVERLAKAPRWMAVARGEGD